MYQDKQIEPETDGYQVRSSERTPMSFLAALIRDGRPDVEVRVRNFSREGFSVISDDKLAADERFRLRLPHTGDVRSHVIWSRGKRYGCEFEKSLTPQQVAEVLKEASFDKRRYRSGIAEIFSRIFSRA